MDEESHPVNMPSHFLDPIEREINTRKRATAYSRVRFSTWSKEDNPLSELRNGANIHWDRKIFETLLKNPATRKKIYFSFLILCLFLCFRLWWNLTYENLVIRDLQHKVITNAFGSNTIDQLFFSEGNLRNDLETKPPIARLHESSFQFKKGFFSAYFTSQGEFKNVTFAKIINDVSPILLSQEEKQGCFCANELGISVDAIFIWRNALDTETAKQKRELLFMYSPSVTFATDEHYQAKYELGAFICAKKIVVDFLKSNGESDSEKLSEFLAVCVCSCQDFIEKMISEQHAKLLRQ